MKIVLVYEHFFPPFDEGVKNVAFQLHQHYKASYEVVLVRYLKALPNVLNSLLLVPRLFAMVFQKPDKLVFMPQAALTFSSLLKIWALHLVYADKLTVLGVQKRQLKPWQTRLISRLNMPQTFVLSSSMAKPLEAMNIRSEVVEIGINRELYQPCVDKLPLRKKYHIDPDKRVLLHVGHIKESRNIHWLLDIKESMPELHVVLVGSTATEQDDKLREQLEAANIQVMRDYNPDIHEIYQLADIYCFPVILDNAAMETPLSVLEAMSTNLPVITTPFGRLTEQFGDDGCYRYFNTVQEALELLQSDFGAHCLNRGKTEPYSWRATAERLLINTE